MVGLSCIRISHFSLRTTRIRVLRENECDNESVQGQGFTENEHNQHADVEFIGAFGAQIRFINASSTALIFAFAFAPVEFATILVLEAKGLHADIAQNTNRTTRRQTTETAAQTGSKLCMQ